MPKGPRTIVKPLTAETSRLNVTARDATLAKLKRARELLRGKSDDEILDLAVDLLLEKKAPERRHARREAKRERKNAAPQSASEKDCVATPAPRPRQAPLADRDRAHVEAGGQCTFVGDDGHRCGARSFIESDHVVPFALGGESTYENARAFCRSYNHYEAEKIFGAWNKG